VSARSTVAAALAAGTVVAAALAVVACGTKFDIKKYAGSTQKLYDVSMEQLRRHHWDEAVQGFERLTLDLPAHDTLLAQCYYYLGQAHQHKHEPLLAAQSYERLAEAFPDDSLAPLALYDAGLSYSSMWRRPELDSQYGESALGQFQTLVALYPTSPFKDRSDGQITRLQEWFARKDFGTGLHYLRRKAYDSAILYFKDVIKNYPNAVVTRSAYIRLVDAYRAIRYRDDAADVCAILRTAYPQDLAVQKRCLPPAPAPATAARH
jgi:outer membrane protein assembly factor BamD